MAREIRFGPFRMDLAGERLWRGDEAVPLRPKTWSVLRHLAERPGELVTRDQLMAAVWPDLFVSQELPRISIRELRVALGDDAKLQRYIETVPRRGFRFVAAVDVDLGGDETTPSLAGRLAARARAASARIVGRDAEAAALARAAHRARNGSRQVVFVTGDLGIGKTTLIEASLHRLCGEPADGQTVWIGRGQCIEAHGRVEPYQPVLDALEQLAEAVGQERMEGALSRLAPLWKPHLPGFATGGQPAALSAGAGQARMRRELLSLLEELGAEGLVVLVLEDLHWSDAATVDLIAALAARAQPARILLLASYRTVDATVQQHPVLALRAELVRKREVREIPLAALDAGAVLTYLRRRFGGELDERAGAIVHTRSDGNPFAMVATADHLESDGRVVHTPGGWMFAAAHAGEIALPETLRTVAEQQLATLAPFELEILEAASVAGLSFASQSLAAALEFDLAAVEEPCARLARQGRFLRDDGVAAWRDGTLGGAFAFTHVAYRDALYQRVAPARRALWHRRIGERLLASGVQDSDARLALHFERAGDLPRALEFHRRAAAAAAARFAPREAATSLRSALAVLARGPADAETARTELLLQNALGQALQATLGSEAPEVAAAFARARALAEQLAATEEVPSVLVGMFGVQLSRGDLRAALELSEQLLVIGRRSRRAHVRYAGHVGAGMACTHRGDIEAAHRHLRRAVALYPRALGVSPLHPGIFPLCYAARVAFHRGRVQEARARVRQARALADEAGNPLGQAWALQLGAVVAIYLRESEETLALSSALVEVAERNGLEMFARVARMQRGWARVWQEADADAVAEMRRVFNWDGLGQHSAAFVLADASARVGDARAALDVIDRALALPVEERIDRPELLRLRGDLCLARAQQDGDGEAEALADAQASLAAAMRESRAIGSAAFELRAANSLARVLLARRQGGRARRMLEKVCRSFPAGTGGEDLRQARELIAAL